MKNKLALILTLGFLISNLPAATDANKPLHDGFALMAGGMDGTLIKESGRYFFKIENNISDGKGLAPAGTMIEILKSSELDRLIQDANNRTEAVYRLWGKFTAYKNKNYIYPDYFLPLSKPVSTEQPADSKQAAPKEQVPVNEPNDAITIPDEILKKIQNRKIISTEELKKGLDIKEDSILSDRLAFLKKKGDGYIFVLDSLGQNVPTVAFNILPSQILELTEAKKTDSLENPRFKISGVVTKFKGEYYLLPLRAIKMYSNGNFTN